MTVHEQEYLDRLADAVAERVLAALDAPRDGLLTVDQAARQIGISPRGVRDLVNGRDGKPPKLASFKVGPSEGTRVIRQSAVDAYIAEREAAA